MPSVSKSQERLMNAVAHNPQFAHKAGIPQSVGEEFHEADKAADKRSLPERIKKRYKKHK